jgi:hypothetical protein
MRILNSIAVATLVAVAFAGALGAVEVGDIGPDFAFDKSWNTPAGFTMLADYRGKVVMVEAWGTG